VATSAAVRVAPERGDLCDHALEVRLMSAHMAPFPLKNAISKRPIAESGIICMAYIGAAGSDGRRTRAARRLWLDASRDTEDAVDTSETADGARHERIFLVVSTPRPAKAKPSEKARMWRLVPWDPANPLALFVHDLSVDYFSPKPINKIRRAMRRAGEDLIMVSEAEAAKLRFPDMHPCKNVVYTGHPADPGCYIPLSDFHVCLFRLKVAEALELFRCLGAETIEVACIEGWDQIASVRLSSVFPADVDVHVDMPISVEHGSGYSILATMRFPHPAQPPSIPPRLTWLHDWDGVIQARLKGGLSDFSICVESENDYGINAGLLASLSISGVGGSVSFTEHRYTVWRLRGTFADWHPATEQ
jgi:hypothetical protein